MTDPYRQSLALRSAEDERVREILQRELATHEQLLWVGTPARGIKLVASDLIVVPFSLVWCGFACFWEVTVILSDAPWFFCAFGVPFVLVGFYFVFGRFLVEARKRARTFYGVSTRRVLLVERGRGSKLTAIDLATASEMSLDERRNGSGTILLGPRGPGNAASSSTWPGTQRLASPALLDIPRAREVFETIRDAQDALHRPR